MRGHSRPRLYGRGKFRFEFQDSIPLTRYIIWRDGEDVQIVVDHHVAATAQTAIIRTRDRRRDGRVRQFGVPRSETAAAIRGRRYGRAMTGSRAASSMTALFTIRRILDG